MKTTEYVYVCVWVDTWDNNNNNTILVNGTGVQSFVYDAHALLEW